MKDDVKSRVGHDDGWPRPLGDAAYHGLAGDIVEIVLPETEADPANLLISFLVAFGNSIGRNAHIELDAALHYANEFAVIVGPTAMSRKGSGLNQVKRVFTRAEETSNRNETWTDCIKQGLSTGEGLITHFAPHAAPDGDDDDDGHKPEPIPVDPRLMVVESELARLLIVMNRPDNILSTTIRQAWEVGELSVMTRKNPLDVKGVHVSIIGHITTEELRKHLAAVDRANGFANRFMFAMVKRSKELPFGGEAIDYGDILPTLGAAQRYARGVGLMRRAGNFNEIWPKHYTRLTADRAGMFGAITSRGASHVMRLAMIYALLDKTKLIRDVHLKAALEVWRYCEDSVRYIFGTNLGDDTADTILIALRRSEGGLTRTEISKVCSHNKAGTEITRALSVLEREGLAECETAKKGRRPTEIWHATG